MKDKYAVLLGIVSGVALSAIAVMACVYKAGYATPVFYVSIVLACYLAFLVYLCLRLHKEFLLESKKREQEILDKELVNKKAFLQFEYDIMKNTEKEKKESQENEAEKTKELERQLKERADQNLLISRFALFLYLFSGKEKRIEDIDLKTEFEKLKGNYKELQEFVEEIAVFVKADKE